MRINCQFRDWETDALIDKWVDAEHWVGKDEQVVVLNTQKRYRVVRVVHIGQFSVDHYLEEIR